MEDDEDDLEYKAIKNKYSSLLYAKDWLYHS